MWRSARMTLHDCDDVTLETNWSLLHILLHSEYGKYLAILHALWRRDEWDMEAVEIGRQEERRQLDTYREER
jgi:hypothetical protein